MSPPFKLIVALFASAFVAPCQAQQDAKLDEAATKKAVTAHWLGVADSLAQDYVFTPADAVDSPFMLQEKAIFRHTQTVRGDDIGAVYVTDYQLAVSIDDEKVWESPEGTVSENGKPHYWDFLEQRPKPDFEP